MEEEKNDISHMGVQTKPKLIRFESYNLAFAYFLKSIKFHLVFQKDKTLHRTQMGRDQRRWLLEVAHQTLCKAHWAKDGNGDWVLITTETTMEDGTGNYQRMSFTDEEYKQVLSWELIDYQVRLILEKKSFLSRNLRNYVMEVFTWVDNFVAKEGEEVTMTAEDLLIKEEVKD